MASEGSFSLISAAPFRSGEKTAAIRTIVNRIKLFENQTGSVGAIKPTHPRSADVSPARSIADRVKLLDQSAHTSGQRASSADRANSARSSSALPARPKVQTVREQAKNVTSTAAAASAAANESRPAKVKSTQPQNKHIGPSKQETKQHPGTFKKAQRPPEAAAAAQSQPTIKGKSSSASSVTKTLSAVNTPSEPSCKPVEQEQTPLAQPAQGKDHITLQAPPEKTPTQLTHRLTREAEDTPPDRISRDDKPSRDTRNKKSSQTKDITYISRRENTVPDKDNQTKETSQSSAQTLEILDTKDSVSLKGVVKTVTKQTIASNNGSQAKDVVNQQIKDTLTSNNGLANDHTIQVICTETEQGLKTNNSPETQTFLEIKDSPQTRDAKILTKDTMNLKDNLQNDVSHLSRDNTTADKSSNTPGTEVSPTTENIHAPENGHLNEKMVQNEDGQQANDSTEMNNSLDVLDSVVTKDMATTNVGPQKESLRQSALEVSPEIKDTDTGGSLDAANIPKTLQKDNTQTKDTIQPKDVSPQKEEVAEQIEHLQTSGMSGSKKRSNKEATQPQSPTNDTKQEITSYKQEVQAKMGLSPPSNHAAVKELPEVKTGLANQNMTGESKMQNTEKAQIPFSEPVGQTVIETVVETAKLADREYSDAKSRVAENKTVKEEEKVVSSTASAEQALSPVQNKRVEEKSEEVRFVSEQLTEAKNEDTKVFPEQPTKANSEETVVVLEQSAGDSKKTEANTQPASVSPPAFDSNSSKVLKQANQTPDIHTSSSTDSTKKPNTGSQQQLVKEVPDQIKMNSEDPSSGITEQRPSKDTTNAMSAGADATQQTRQSTSSDTKDTQEDTDTQTKKCDTNSPALGVSMTSATHSPGQSAGSHSGTCMPAQNSGGITVAQDPKSTSQSQDEIPNGKSEEQAVPLANMANGKPAKSLNEVTGTKITAGVNCETQSNSPSQKTSNTSTLSGTVNETSPLSSPASEKLSSLPSSSSFQDSTRKKNNLKSLKLRDFPAASQDAPSSWLDVDVRPSPKPRQPIRSLKLSASVSNLLGPSGEFDPQDFMERVKKLAIPFSVPPRSKLKMSRTMAPSFTMPAIKEDRFEKTFDPDEFKFGLRKRREFSLELTKLREKVCGEKEPVEDKLKRPHLDRGSILVKSLLLRDTEAAKEKIEEEEGGKGGEKEEGGEDKRPKIKSRLEGSSILSSLRSSSRGSRLGLLSPREDTGSGLTSPNESLSPRSPTTMTTSPNDPTKSFLDHNHTGSTATQLNQNLTEIKKHLPNQSNIVKKIPTEITKDPYSSNQSKVPEANKKRATISNDLFSLNQSTQIAKDPYSSNQPNLPEVNNKLTQSTQSYVKGDQSNSQSNQSTPQISQSEPSLPSATTTDSGPRLPSFDDIKLPGYLEKLLPRDHGKVDPLQKPNSEVSLLHTTFRFSYR